MPRRAYSDLDSSLVEDSSISDSSDGGGPGLGRKGYDEGDVTPSGRRPYAPRGRYSGLDSSRREDCSTTGCDCTGEDGDT